MTVRPTAVRPATVHGGRHAATAAASLPVMPDGFTITLDQSVRALDDRRLFGGSPGRVLRLSDAGLAALAELQAGGVHTAATGALARRLTDATLAHPQPPPVTAVADVTVVIPVFDRPDGLDRALRGLGRAYPVVVVDDASSDAAAVAAVAKAHGARLIARDVNGGPAAARNTGLAAVQTGLVAFLDSDCVPTRGWLEILAAHLADPLVAVAAPRIVSQATATTLAAGYAASRGILDLGQQPARVQPLSRVAYVPSAALVARTSALRDAEAFDATMRVGEDVDLIWRLHNAGWRVRYEPRAVVVHREPSTWRAVLGRRFRYGTSTGPLARRHPAAMPTAIVSSPWRCYRSLRGADVPPGLACATTWRSDRQAAHDLVRSAWQLGWPLLMALALRGRRWPLLLIAAFAARTCRPLAYLAEEAAYGTGVWTGAVRSRTAVPLLPAVAKGKRA